MTRHALIRHGRLRAVVVAAVVLVSPLLQASAIGLFPAAPATLGDELSSSSYIATRDSLLGPIPTDPIAAAQLLVSDILGPNDGTAQVATIELLRQAGIPVINVDDDIVAMPDDGVIGNAPMMGEFLAQLTRSVRDGYFYTMADVANIFQDSGAATVPIPPEMLLAGVAEWGKLPGSPRESIVAGTAVRELGIARGEPLFSGIDPTDAQVDMLQFTLLYDHLVGASEQVDTTALKQDRSAATGLFAPSVARADSDCKKVYDLLQLKPYQGGPAATVTNTAFKDAFFQYLQELFGDAAKTAKDGLKYVDYASKTANLIIYLTSLQLDVQPSTSQTHFRHSPGDTSRDVTVVATATWQQGDTLQDLQCLQGLAGIGTRANGPMPGLRVRWRMEQEQTAARNGKLMRAKLGQGQEFTPTGMGGELTNDQGKSDVVLEPAAEKNPGVGALLSGNVTVYASLDKDSVPDALKAFLGQRTFLYDYLRDTTTKWPKFLFDQLFGISLQAIMRAGMPVRKTTIKVQYHGADAYAIQGTRSPFVVFYAAQVTVNAYTCDGLNGTWHGNATFHADKQFLTQLEEQVVGQTSPDSMGTNATINQFLDLRGRSDYLTILDPFRLKVTVDNSLIDRGQYGTVGSADLTIGESSIDFLLFFDPEATIPVIRLNKDNQPDLDELCPNNESYFP